MLIVVGLQLVTQQRQGIGPQIGGGLGYGAGARAIESGETAQHEKNEEGRS